MMAEVDTPPSVPDQPTPPNPAPARPTGQQELRDTTDLDDRNLYAAMSYLIVLVVVPLLMRKNDPFVNFHARQGLIILAGFILASIASSWSSVVGSLVFVVLLFVDVIGLVMALQGRQRRIPGISWLADKFSI